MIAPTGLLTLFLGALASGQEREEAGVIFGTTKISRDAYQTARSRVLGHERYALLMQLCEQFQFATTLEFLISFVLRQVRDLDKGEAIKKTWRTLILLHRCAEKGIRPTAEDTRGERDAFLRLLRKEGQEAAPAAEAATFLGIPERNLDSFLQEALSIRRLLDDAVRGEFASVRECYEELWNEHAFGRVRFASFDPRDYAKDLLPPTDKEI